MLEWMKDKALSKGAVITINKYLEPYGEVQTLKIDTKKKSISMEALLKGEHDSLAIEIEKYTLAERDGKHLLQITGLKTSREWINILSATYLEGREFEIPSEYADMLRIMV